MTQNYLKITLRNLVRNKGYTALNLLSLVIGLFVSYVAIAYINYEYSYDKFHENEANIYRLGRTFRSQNYGIIGFEKWNESSAEGQISQIEALKKIAGIKNATQFIVSTS